MFVLMTENRTAPLRTENKKADTITIALTGPTRDLTKQTVHPVTVDAGINAELLIRTRSRGVRVCVYNNPTRVVCSRSTNRRKLDW